MLNGVVIGNQMVTINTNIWRDDFLRTENLRFQRRMGHESLRFYDAKSVEISSILVAPFFLLFVQPYETDA